MSEQTFEAQIEGFLPFSLEQAWEALATDKGFTKIYPGITAKSDWKVGASIIWSGEWEGKPFKDEGAIISYDKPKLFVYTYWSSFWGLPHTPQNTQTIQNEFEAVSGGTRVKIVQSNIPSVETRDQSAKNWHDILEKMTKTLEGDRK